MWSKRPSQLLLVRISRGGLRRLVVPVPLFVFDLTLAAFSDLACLLDSLVPQWMRSLRRFNLSGPGAARMSAASMLAVCLQLFREIRKYGRFRLLDVRSGKIRVFIDFY
ncbi:MAG: hypothetical protein C4589_01425 [Peptococcaceae bacterium]|nr:MAG: hypothetical protein C4589_01425 [Peptococcaceae bacterium]